MKVDSRFMLPAEILCALYGFAWAAIGGLEPHFNLYQFLAARDNNFTWLLIIGGTSLFVFAVATGQLLFGRCWSNESIYRAIVLRWMASALMALSWLYVLKTVASYAGGTGGVLTFIAWASLLFTCWSFYENGKVLHAIKHPEDSGLVLHR